MRRWCGGGKLHGGEYRPVAPGDGSVKRRGGLGHLKDNSPEDAQQRLHPEFAESIYKRIMAASAPTVSRLSCGELCVWSMPSQC